MNGEPVNDTMKHDMNASKASNKERLKANYFDALQKLFLSKVFWILVGAVVLCAALFAWSYYVCATPLIEKSLLVLEQKVNEGEFALDASELKGDPTSKPSYALMTEKEQQAYCSIYEAVWLHRDSVSIEGLSSDELWDVYIRMRYDSPEIFDLDFGATTHSTIITTLTTNSIVAIDFNYFSDLDTIVSKRKEMATELASAIELLDDTEDDRAKAILLHDWLCERTSYAEDDEDNDAHSAYGALCEGASVCEGYALAYGLLCDQAGLSNRVIVGHMSRNDDPTLAHAWNAVTCNGEELYVDSTFNDGRTISHKYLLRDDAFMARNGYIPYENNIPEA